MATITNFTTNQLALMSGSSFTPTSYFPGILDNHYIEFNVYDKDTKYITSFDSKNDDFTPVYSPPISEDAIMNGDFIDSKLLINPNDALNRVEQLKAKIIPSGKYTLELNFYRDFDALPYNDIQRVHHIVDEISNSRKEIRCVLRNLDNTNFIAAEDFYYNQNLGSMDENNCLPSTNWNALDLVQKIAYIATGDVKCYPFNWVLKSDKYPDRTFTIINWEIDDITDPGLPTIVFKFDESLPGLIKRLDEINVVEEVYPTQTENILFIKQDVLSTTINSLTPNTEMTPLISGDTSTYQSYNEVSSSFVNGNAIDQIVSSSANNLNIDYNTFPNHTHFGSATIKLENFKRKIGNLQGQWTNLSSSLANSGSVKSLQLQRQESFKKINEIVNTFTPYEQFLYSDYQTETTASAPGLGRNLTRNNPLLSLDDDINVDNNLTTFQNYEDLPTVYRISGSSSDRTPIHLFTNKYKVHNPPFFNSTGSYYLSFWAKNDENYSGSTSLITSNINKFYNQNDYTNLPQTTQTVFGLEGYSSPDSFAIPQDAGTSTQTGSWVSNSVSASITGSNWRQVVLVNQNNYWRPLNDNQINGDIGTINNWSGADQIEVLSGSNVSASFYQDGYAYGISDSDGNHGSLMAPTSMSADGSILNTDVYRTGSVLPSGPMFTSYYYPDEHDSGNDNQTSHSMFITDVKITKNNPLNALPFSSLYPTGSYQFDNWYTNVSSSAVTYDESNIHSFKNNLPQAYRDSINADDLRKFLNLWGEHFDSIKNYIDNYANFYKRGYKKTNSVPDNLLPILTENLGWELIQPFSSSLSNIFEDYAAEGGDNEKDIINNTWKKTLNNLMYIYKSKGTRNSLDGLLNTYGYPTQYLSLLNEYGSTDDSAEVSTFSTPSDNETNVTNPGIANSYSKGLINETGSITYVKSIETLTTLDFTNPPIGDPGESTKKLELDWMADPLTDEIDCIEFLFKPSESSTIQSLLASTGSYGFGTDANPWALEFTNNSLRFHIANDGNGRIASAKQTMQLNLTGSAYKLWNVMLTRDASNERFSNPATYKLYAALQENDKITQFHHTSMSVSSSAATDAWGTPIGPNLDDGLRYSGTTSPSFGSYGHFQSGSNLWVGSTLTGSMAEIRGWRGELSSSVFRKHVLNKKDYTGNTIDSWRDDLIWHYKLDENQNSSSADFTIVNSSTKKTRTIANTTLGRPDFDRPVSGSLGKYGKTQIVTYRLVPSSTNYSKNDNNIIIADKTTYTSKLSPKSKSTIPFLDSRLQTQKTSQKISLVRSPIDAIDNYLTNMLSGKNLKNQIKPGDMYEPKYSNLEDLHKKTITERDVKTDVTKFIKANKKIFTPMFISSVKKVIPGRSNIEKMGIEFRQNLLTKAKYQYKKPSVEDASGPSGSMNMTTTYTNLSGNYISPSTGSLNLLTNFSGSFINTHDGDIINSVDDLFSLNSTFQASKDSIIDMSRDLTSTNEASKDSEIIIPNNLDAQNLSNYTKELFPTPILSSLHDSEKSYNITDLHSVSSLYDSSKDTTIDINSTIGKNAEYLKPYDDSINLRTSVSTQYDGVFTDSLDIAVPISSSYIKPTEGLLLMVQPMSSSYTTTHDSTISISQKFSSENISEKSSTINILEDISTSYEAPKDVSISINNELSTEYVSVYQDLLNITPVLSQNYNATYEDTIEITNSTLKNSIVQMISEFTNVYSSTIQGGSAMNGTSPGTAGSYEIYLDAENLELRDSHTRSWEGVNQTKSWGRTYDDTHYIYDWAEINIANADDPTTGSDAFGNVYYREPRYVFTDIGDKSWLSSSLEAGETTLHWDSSNYKQHKNLTIVDAGQGYIYESFMGESGDFTEDGRPVGKTSYFSQSNVPISGNMHLPSNHINNFADNGNVWSYKYIGAQLMNYKYMWHPDDLTTSSYYRTKVSLRRSIKTAGL